MWIAATAARTGPTETIAANPHWTHIAAGSAVYKALPVAFAMEPEPRGHILPLDNGVAHMTDIEEEKIARQIDRDVSDKGSLVALVFCLLMVIGLLVAGTSAYLNAG